MSSHFLYFDFDGRIDRTFFWYGLAGLAVMFAAINLFTQFVPQAMCHFIFGMAYTASIYLLAALVTKRLRDRGRSQYLSWLFLGVPVAYGIFSLLIRPAASDTTAVIFSFVYLLATVWAVIELGLIAGKPEHPGSPHRSGSHAGRPRSTIALPGNHHGDT